MPEGIITSIVCLVTGVTSAVAFQNDSLKEKLLFDPRSILAEKQWYRLVSSALVHSDFSHLAFNLIALYSFGSSIESEFGGGIVISIYLASIVGGSLLSLFLHRNHEYRALGASGGVCGVMFAAIFMQPGTGVGAFLLPISIPGPIFALLYLGFTFYALRKGEDNIGHDAHFGGAVVGLFLALCIVPKNCLASPVLFSFCLLFSIFCLVKLARDPMCLRRILFDGGDSDYKPNIRYAYERSKTKDEEEEVDRILDKISKSGIDSLSAKETARLKKASERLKR